MSLDARVKQGLNSLVDPIDVDYELGLVRVQAVARQRERRNVMIAAFAGAAAAIALLAGGGRLADMVLGIEKPLPSVDNPNIQDDRGIDESRFDEDSDGDKVVQDDNLRVDEALDQADLQPVDGGTFDIAGRSNGSSAYIPPSRDNDGIQTEPTDPTDETVGDPEESRSKSLEYNAAAPVPAACVEEQDGPMSWVCFDVRESERFVKISLSDDSGQPVGAAVTFEDGNSFSQPPSYEEHLICGESDGYLRVPEGAAAVYVILTDGPPDCARATTGTATGSFAV